MAQVSIFQARLTPDEYLATENDGPVRREFVDGHVYAMAGASERHKEIGVEQTIAAIATLRSLKTGYAKPIACMTMCGSTRSL